MQIYIPGVPLPRARMRHYTRDGANGVWDPQRLDMIRIGLRIKEACIGHEPIKCPLRVRFTFAMPIPPSFSKKKRLTAIPSKKPDVDNLCKLASDVCNSRVWVDDCQIVELHACKIYSENPYTLIDAQCCDGACLLHSEQPEELFTIPWQGNLMFPMGARFGLYDRLRKKIAEEAKIAEE